MSAEAREAPPELGRPLDGCRVLDLGLYVPVPFCTLLLAELGAEVWKLERPGAGDPLRRLDAAAFERLNRGKKSLVLDLKRPEGRRAAERLVAAVDVLVEGFRPGVMERLGLGPGPLLRRHPRLVYVSISGYGQDGPYRGRAGHDLDYLAAGGGLGETPPPIQLADFAAGGLYGALVVVAALQGRERSGRGAYVDLSMLDGVVSFLPLALSRAGELLSGRYPCYGVYETADGGRLAVGALEPKFWERVCMALERPDLVSRGFDPEARAEVSSVFRERPLAAWESRFDALDACVERVRTPAEALDHPQARHRRRGGPPLAAAFRRPATPAPAPALGEHTAEILAAAGLDAEERVRLVDGGAG